MGSRHKSFDSLLERTYVDFASRGSDSIDVNAIYPRSAISIHLILLKVLYTARFEIGLIQNSAYITVGLK